MNLFGCKKQFWNLWIISTIIYAFFHLPFKKSLVLLKLPIKKHKLLRVYEDKGGTTLRDAGPWTPSRMFNAPSSSQWFIFVQNVTWTMRSNPGIQSAAACGHRIMYKRRTKKLVVLNARWNVPLEKNIFICTWICCLFLLAI